MVINLAPCYKNIDGQEDRKTHRQTNMIANLSTVNDATERIIQEVVISSFNSTLREPVEAQMNDVYSNFNVQNRIIHHQQLRQLLKPGFHYLS